MLFPSDLIAQQSSNGGNARLFLVFWERGHVGVRHATVFVSPPVRFHCCESMLYQLLSFANELSPT